MSAARRRRKALDRQANVHRLGICGGPGRCPLWHGQVSIGPAGALPGDLRDFRPLQGIESVSFSGRAG